MFFLNSCLFAGHENKAIFGVVATCYGICFSRTSISFEWIEKFSSTNLFRVDKTWIFNLEY